MAEICPREALVACSDKNMSAGITVWDLQSGEVLFHIPTCASPPHGLICLRDQFLVASQVQKHRSFGGGAIFTWPLNRPQALQRSYPLESIGPLLCTKDGLFLVGGAPSGNAYAWEVPSGRLLKIWRAHHKSLTCLCIAGDDSLLISASDSGAICVWTMISVLDVSDSQQCGILPCLYSWSEHQSPITALLSASGVSSSVLISSSLDGTCKAWDLVCGRLLQTYTFSLGITAIALDPDEQVLFSGSEDGSIFITALDVWLQDSPDIILVDQSMALRRQKRAVTALAFSTNKIWLISASEDCTVCFWDVRSWQVTRILDHGKGRITNLLVIQHPSLLTAHNERNHHRLSVSSLDKAPLLTNGYQGTRTLLPTSCSREDHQAPLGFQCSDSMNQQILDLKGRRTPEAIQMKVEAAVQNRLWALSMTKHVTAMNKHLRARLLDLMQCQLSPDISEKRKKPRVSDQEEPPQPLG